MKESPFKLTSTSQLTFQTVEHFYQSMKIHHNDENCLLIATAKTPYEAKSMGRKVKDPFQYLLDNNIFDEDFKTIDDVKLFVMEIGLGYKFAIPDWRKKLLATGDEQIIEWNNWNDKFWGVSIKDNLGENHLGRLLMELRDKIK